MSISAPKQSWYIPVSRTEIGSSPQFVDPPQLEQKVEAYETQQPDQRTLFHQIKRRFVIRNVCGSFRRVAIR
jgi:hypothetical protein